MPSAIPSLHLVIPFTTEPLTFPVVHRVVRFSTDKLAALLHNPDAALSERVHVDCEAVSFKVGGYRLWIESDPRFDGGGFVLRLREAVSGRVFVHSAAFWADLTGEAFARAPYPWYNLGPHNDISGARDFFLREVEKWRL